MNDYQKTNNCFYSPTHGELTLASVRTKILEFMSNDPESQYRIVIGSDSAPKEGVTLDFITALVIHRVGKGGVYFWKRSVIGKAKLDPHNQKIHKDKKNIISLLRQRIYQEATLSLEAAETFLEVVKNDGITKFDVEIHVDIGKFGETREMITEVMGMIRGSGFKVKMKPESYGASKIADRHT